MNIKRCFLIRSVLSLHLTYGTLSVLSMAILLAGCSGGPTRIQPPSFDPSSAASSAMKIYDSNEDGFVAGEELENAPGLKAAMENLDADADGKVSREEIENRVATWKAQGIGLMRFTCDVLLDGKPVEGATVILEPEEFLQATIQEATGETDVFGTASPRIPKEKRPSPTDPPGVQAGIYKVRISKEVGGKEVIPVKYNAKTTLGQEVSMDDKSIMNKQVVYTMKSK